MSNKHATSITCPAGEHACYVIDLVHELQQQLRHDALTELYNYRHFMDVLDIEMARTQRSREPTSLLMIDIDHFKQVNDTWGHDIGNRALRHVADLLRQHSRKIDLVCRYGGEEFTVILPSTPLKTALDVAQRLRQAIEELPLGVEDGSLPLTVSIGAESYRPSMQLEPEEFVRLADSYLYQAKEAGRNCVRAPLPPSATEVGAEEKALLFS